MVTAIDLKEAEQALYRSGFAVKRLTGGHTIYGHPDGRTFALPNPARRKGLKGRGHAQDRLAGQLKRMGIQV